VLVSIEGGEGYTVGSGASAVVVIADDDSSIDGLTRDI